VLSGCVGVHLVGGLRFRDHLLQAMVVQEEAMKKAKKKSPPSQTCTSCAATNVRIVTSTTVCVECFVWPPEEKTRPQKKERAR